MEGRQGQAVSEAIERERARLWNFIRSRIPNQPDAEDILQDVFYEFVEAYHLMKPVRNAGAWMFRVARNRITDWFRKKKPQGLSDAVAVNEDGGRLSLEDLLPTPEAGPEAAYARSVLIEELIGAVEDLPENQRRVFVAHELEGRSFKEIAAETGVSVNTLLSRKRYAVLRLRQQLQLVHDEFTKG